VVAVLSMTSVEAVGQELEAGQLHPSAAPGAVADDRVKATGVRDAEPPFTAGLEAAATQSHATAAALSQATQLAISPLLVMTVIGAVRYFQTPSPQRSDLPFFVQPWFWTVGLVLLALIFFKETVIARVPLAKKPLDVLQLFENKVTGLLASPLAIGGLAVALHSAFSPPALVALVGVPTAYARAMPGDALTQLTLSQGASELGSAASVFGVSLGWVLAFVGATALYGAVWMASHSINVLILLSPFALVDNVLKLMRFGLLMTVVLSAQVHPYIGACVSVVLMLLALAISGWSFRLSRFGVSFCLGLLRAPAPVEVVVPAFSGRGMRLPIRTKGVVLRVGARAVFRYRRFFLLSKAIELPVSLRIEKGLFHPVLVSVESGQRAVLCRFSPAYQGQENALAEMLGAEGVDEAPLARRLRGFARWFREAVTGMPEELDGSLSPP
jgi:hypothetical protein